MRTPPDDAGREPADWPPLRLGAMPPADDFPLDELPELVARLAAEIAAAVGCDPGMAAAPMIATAAGLIGRTASLRLGPNHFASPSLFMANVAMPGDGKSPALEYARRPIDRIENALAENFNVLKIPYLESLRAPRSRKRGDGDEAIEAPAPPIPKRAVVDDSTMEGLFRVMATNPRGLTLLNDELSALILGLGQYKGGKGSDRSALLKIWSGSQVLIDRVLNALGEPIRIPHPCLSICGNMPPAMLGAMINPAGDDGLIDRWLYVFPERRPRLKSRERGSVSDDTAAEWDRTAHKLWTRQMRQHEGRDCPHVVSFTETGREVYDRLYDRHVDEVNDRDFPDALRGPWSKLETYASRLCLVLALLDHAADPTADAHSLPDVTPAIALSAWRLVGYHKSQFRRVRAYLEGRGIGSYPDGARWITNWLRNHPDAATVSRADLTRTYSPERGYDRATLEDGFAWLERQNAIRRVPQSERPRGTRGQKPAPSWEVHPDFLDRLGIQGNQPIDPPIADSAESPDSPEDMEEWVA